MRTRCKNITKLAFKRWNFLQNVFFYSFLTGLTFSNFELQMLCVMNCKKINKCIGNQQCNRHLHFLGQHYTFQGYFQDFSVSMNIFKALKICTLNSRTSTVFQDLYEPCKLVAQISTAEGLQRNSLPFCLVPINLCHMKWNEKCNDLKCVQNRFRAGLV